MFDAQVREGLDVHLMCCHYLTLRRLSENMAADHPRFCMHFRPIYSSWLNQFERFFGFVTEDLRSDHRGVQALESAPKNG
jgi:hypothetical protein